MKRSYITLIPWLLIALTLVFSSIFFFEVVPRATAQSGTPIFPTFGAVTGGGETAVPAPPSLTPDPNATIVLVTATPISATLTAAAPTPTFTPEPPTITPGPSPTPLPSLSAEKLGIQIHGFLTDAEFDAMLNHAAQLGVKWVKFQMDWRLHEPSPGQFSPEYAAKVLGVQRASVRGFKTMLSVAKAPDWARPENVRGNEDGPPADYSQLANYLRRMIGEIKPEFIDAIELWNEPNLIREWRGKTISGAEYMNLFRVGYDAIQQAVSAAPSPLKPNHRIIVITAGPAPTVTFPDGSSLEDRAWLSQLYQHGLRNYGDDVVIGAHPYGWGNPPEAKCCAASPGVTGWYEHPSFYFRDTLDAYRDITLQNGDANRKIWVTEFGWATYDGLKRSDGTAAMLDPNSGIGWVTLINAQQQAEYVFRAFYLAQQPPYSDFVGPMVLWNLNFATVPGLIDNGREEPGFSLLDQSGQPRLVYWTLARAPKIAPQ